MDIGWLSELRDHVLKEVNFIAPSYSDAQKAMAFPTQIIKSFLPSISGINQKIKSKHFIFIPELQLNNPFQVT